MDELQRPERVAMSQLERDAMRVIRSVIDGERTQVDAARLHKKSTRQVRRMQRKLDAGGAAALVHRLRSKPSNRHHNATFRARVLRAYRARHTDFGPNFARKKLTANHPWRKKAIG